MLLERKTASLAMARILTRTQSAYLDVKWNKVVALVALRGPSSVLRDIDTSIRESLLVINKTVTCQTSTLGIITEIKLSGEIQFLNLIVTSLAEELSKSGFIQVNQRTSTGRKNCCTYIFCRKVLWQ